MILCLVVKRNPAERKKSNMTENTLPDIVKRRGRPAKEEASVVAESAPVEAPAIVSHTKAHPVAKEVCEKLRCEALPDESPLVFTFRQFTGAQLCVNLNNFKDHQGDIQARLVIDRLIAAGFIG